MRPKELLETIYLGDRACKSMTMDGWNRRVTIHVDVISRIRSPDGQWNYYTAEDIADGRLVFDDVEDVALRPQGAIPNDLINGIVVTEGDDASVTPRPYVFSLSVDSVDNEGKRTEVIVEIRSKDFYIQDPRRPDHQVRD